MRLYQAISCDELEIDQYYAVRTNPTYYYIGKFVKQHGELFKFYDTFVVLFGNRQIERAKDPFDRSPLYFTNDKLFMRIVYEKEQKDTYRSAFEKRAVNQIVASIIGHAGEYF